MNPQEFWIAQGSHADIVTYSENQAKDLGWSKEPIHVIEKSAYDKAVEALKEAQKENEKLLKFKEEMWKLGQAMPPNAISMMIQRELGKFGETNSSRVGGLVIPTTYRSKLEKRGAF